MKEDNSIVAVGNILGAVAAHIEAVNIGIDPSTEVAAQCIEGRSCGKYLVFHSTIRVDSRYEGMRKAFGDDTEIFRKPWDNKCWLSTADYDKLVDNANTKYGSKDMNQYIERPLPFHVVRWGWKAYGRHVATGYILISLFPMLWVAFIRWMLGENGTADMLYAVSFMVISAFDGYLLDIMRDVCYITVDMGNVSESSGDKWVELYKRAGEFPITANVALYDLAHGGVRRKGENLLIPVLAVRTTLTDRWASWFCILTDLRKVLMAIGFFACQNLFWGYLYGLAAALQACLQREVAEQYISVVTKKTGDIIWFRELPGYKYPPMERTPLDANNLSSRLLRSVGYNTTWEGNVGAGG